MPISDELTILGSMTPDYNLEIMDSHKLVRLLKKFLDKPLEITLCTFHRQRTLSQNRYCWGVIVPTVKGWLKETQGETYTKDEVYYYVNAKALGRRVIIKEVAGEEVPILEGKRFSQMTTVEFAEAVDKIVEYFGELGLEILLPKPKGSNLISEFLDDE